MITEELGWVPIQNVAYSPNNNPIESIFSIVKRKYRDRVVNSDKDRSANGAGELVQKRQLITEIFNEMFCRDCSRLILGA
jgi:hypothetical protein